MQLTFFTVLAMPLHNTSVVTCLSTGSKYLLETLPWHASAGSQTPRSSYRDLDCNNDKLQAIESPFEHLIVPNLMFYFSFCRYDSNCHLYKRTHRPVNAHHNIWIFWLDLKLDTTELELTTSWNSVHKLFQWHSNFNVLLTNEFIHSFRRLQPRKNIWISLHFTGCHRQRYI